MKTLRLILGDQLNIEHSWFNKVDDSVIYCLMEIKQETSYVNHHIQKVIGFFAAMRAFAKELENNGHSVYYLKINDSKNLHSLNGNLDTTIDEHSIKKFEYQFPDEYRLDQQLKRYTTNLTINSEAFDSEHFYTSRKELSEFFEGKKQFLMESFYRYMRKKHDLLMIQDQPEGGQWNYDKSNRKKWKGDTTIPEFISFQNNVSDVLSDIEESQIKTIGRFNSDTFDYPISRDQALEQLKYFNEYLLPKFGDFQDAMHTNEVYLYHSRLSFAMNLKLLNPKEIVDSVVKEFRENPDQIDISQVEGFIRQIIGWREYMRGMYWHLMPDFKSRNKLNNNNDLPEFFWTGKTKMNCLKNCINNSLDNAYAHHIQRLMITGNYALLTQTNPNQVDEWYLGIYLDAVEWVQLPNTRGMSQFADGGLIATKPYVSSANYIDKMSNYCENCFYNKKERTTENACPFNSLYWNFLDDKRVFLNKNRRMGMMYRLLDKINPEELSQIKQRAFDIINNPNEY